MKVLEDEKYHSLRVDLIYSQKYGIYILSFICALVFSFIYKDHQNTLFLTGWLSTFAIYVAARFFISIYYWDSKQSSNFNFHKYEEVNFYISVFGGLLWGISAPLFLLEQDPHNLLFAISIYCGVCAGGLISNSTSLKANIGFTFTLLSTTIISFFFYKYAQKHSIIILLSLFNVACIYCAVMINTLVLNNLKLSFKNLKLLEELKASNAKQINIERQAMQSSNLATIGQMASGMAHEINNPLTIIKGNLNLLKRHFKISSHFSTDDYTEKSITKCLHSIDRIVNVIGSLKKMSQMNFNNPIVETTVSEILNDTLGFINEKLKCSNIKLIRNIENEDAIIQCDSTTTSQILLSIFSHAFQVSNQYNLNCIKIQTQVEEEFVYFRIESLRGENKEIKPNTHNSNLSSTTLEKDEFSLNLSLTQSIAKKLGGEFILDKNHPHLFILKLPINQFTKSNLETAA